MRKLINKTLWQHAILCATALMLWGCAVQPERGAERLTLQQVKEIEASGDAQRTARAYNQLAERSTAPQRQEYRLRAAVALVQGNYHEQAKRSLNSLSDQELTVNQFIRRQLLQARIAVAEHNAEAAVSALAIRLPPDTPPELLAQFHRLRADAFTLSGKHLDAARELIAREAYLQEQDSVTKNQQRLWRTLQQLSEAMLTAAQSSSSGVLKGWLELAAIAKRIEQDTLAFKAHIAQWQNRYPDHPATQTIIGSLLARLPEQVVRPTRIAVLLPLSGTYAQPAQALRDGFLLAYYNRSDLDYEPQIRFYDVGDDPGDIVGRYEQALEDGAQFIIGPLNKAAVEALISGTTLNVPTLTLNYTQTDGSTPMLYQFGLSPEDEARQVAERAWLDGYNQAISLVPEGPWGERVYNAFKQYWEALGGYLLETQHYSPDKSDFSSSLRTILNLDESRARRDELQRLLRQDIEFKPRRRQDADFVFMAAFPRQARLIRPQLKFHYAADLPVYATSHIYTGTQDQNADRDLDGVIFCGMPWVLADGSRRVALRSTAQQLWADQFDQYKRFYALGFDAFNIMAHLNRLEQFPYEEYPGQTGWLSLDDSNRIHRRLLWSRFVDGRPKLIDAIMPMSP